jgi:hypothetical protein
MLEYRVTFRVVGKRTLSVVSGRQLRKTDLIPSGAETSTRLAKNETRTQGETWVSFFPSTRNCRFAPASRVQIPSCFPFFSWA